MTLREIALARRTAWRLACSRDVPEGRAWLTRWWESGRTVAMVTMRDEGATIEEIGRAYDLTRERVRQLVEQPAKHARARIAWAERLRAQILKDTPIGFYETERFG